MIATTTPPPIPGNVPDWITTFRDNFDKDVPMGRFIGDSHYQPRWSAYNTGWRTSAPWKTGMYDNGRVGVENGILYVDVATVTDARGTHPRVACLLPRIPASPGAKAPKGLLESRITFSARFPAIEGIKAVPLLWPVDGSTNTTHTDPVTGKQVPGGHGEIDFPEFSLRKGAPMVGFIHRADAIKGNDQHKLTLPVSVIGDGLFHTYTINRKHDWVQFLCDGQLLRNADGEASMKERIPNWEMSLRFQIEPELGGVHVPPAARGRVEIAWMWGGVPDPS